MIPELLIGFILTSMVIELTPGPNMAYLAVLSATEGRRSGYAAVAGIALGLLVVGLLAAVGLAAAISASPVLFQALRWAGVAYLLWLAWDSWREETPENEGFQQGNWRYFRRGLVTNLLNPKAAVFYVSLLPQFVVPGGTVMAQTVGLSLAFVVIATTIHAMIVTLAGTASRFLNNPKWRQRTRRAMAVALVLIAAWFAVSTGAPAAG